MDTSSPTRKPFQSSPGANAGRIRAVPFSDYDASMFQSSPGANAGRICAFLSVRYDTHFEAVRANRPEMHA